MTDERIISRASAEAISDALYGTIRQLEDKGYDRSAVGYCMAGIGAGIVEVRIGHDALFRLLDDIRNGIESGRATKN